MLKQQTSVLTGQVSLSLTNLRELLSAWQFVWQGTSYTNPLKSRTAAVNRIKKKKSPGVDGMMIKKQISFK